MKIKLNKTILLLIILLQCSFSYGQEKQQVTLKNDTVYTNGIPQFICQEKKNEKARIYSLRSMDSKLQGLLIFRMENDTIRFSGTFPYLGLRYTCLYPKIEILTLLDSYIKNKVFVDGKANAEGLAAYCKERELVLDNHIANSTKSPAKRDSILAARAREDAMNQIKFTFHNNAPKPVKVFIGDKPKGGSGRIQIVPPHGDLKEHARKTEKIFLLNDAGDEIKSMAVTDSLKRIVIKASADGFE